VRDVAEQHDTYLGTVIREQDRHDRLCELNVIHQVNNVCSSDLIEAEVNPENTSSNKLLSALRFTLEGRARKRWVAKGVAYDTNLYGLLAPEWRTSAA
jgi:hypothetical protein